MPASQDSFVLTQSVASGVTCVAANSPHAFAKHSHDEFGIGLVDAGAQRSWSGRGMVEAYAGDVISVNANEVHDGVALDRQGRCWRMLYLQPQVVQQAAKDMAIGLSPRTGTHTGLAGGVEFSFPVLRHPLAAQAFRAAYEVAMDVDSGGDAFEERLLALLPWLLDRAQPAAPAPSSIAGIQRLIDANPAEPTSLTAMAEVAGMSKFALVRAFTRHLGLPPHAYRMQKRTQLARRLILQGVSLAGAAAEAGFSDQSHMTRAVRRAYGLTPAKFVAT